MRDHVSGLELLEAIARGDLPAPPITSTLGFGDLEVGPGWTRFHLTPQEFHYNPIGTVHGGVASTMLDSAMGCAIHSGLNSDQGYATTDLRVTFVRPITLATGPIRCEGRVIHLGRKMATAEGKVTDSSGKLYAHGSATFMIFGGVS